MTLSADIGIVHALKVDRVSKRFGQVQALSDVSFSLGPGSVKALIGRNGAGKSTLMSVISGLLSADTGRVEFGAMTSDTPAVGCVYQRTMLVPHLSVAENIALGGFPRHRTGVIDWPQARRRAQRLLTEWDAASVVDRTVESLEPVEKKIVEICRVMAMEPAVLLLDEPTAGLDAAGARTLFARIEAAKSRGVSVLYVSHHLHEVFDICDEAVVLRDGRVVLDTSLNDLTVDDLIGAMVGTVDEHISTATSADLRHDGESAVVIDGLEVDTRLRSLDLEVSAGECVGITGLDGAGHVLIGEAMAGLVKPSAGRITLQGRDLPLGNVRGCIRAGVGFTPEDRHHGGYVPFLSVSENSTLSVLRRFLGRLKLISSRRRDQYYCTLADEWSIKATDPSQATAELSGGNQQKVVLARAVASDPAVLVLINPTAGVDVAAKASISSTIRRMADEGKAVIVISTEDSDFGVCDRVIVLFKGQVSAELHQPISDVSLSRALQGGTL